MLHISYMPDFQRLQVSYTPLPADRFICQRAAWPEVACFNRIIIIHRLNFAAPGIHGLVRKLLKMQYERQGHAKIKSAASPGLFRISIQLRLRMEGGWSVWLQGLLLQPCVMQRQP
jgi:hypothetical protein